VILFSLGECDASVPRAICFCPNICCLSHDHTKVQVSTIDAYIHHFKSNFPSYSLITVISFEIRYIPMYSRISLELGTYMVEKPEQQGTMFGQLFRFAPNFDLIFDRFRVAGT
jgi:hypothetical protein